MSTESEDNGSEGNKQVQNMEWWILEMFGTCWVVTSRSNNDEDDGTGRRTHAGNNCPPGKWLTVQEEF